MVPFVDRAGRIFSGMALLPGLLLVMVFTILACPSSLFCQSGQEAAGRPGTPEKRLSDLERDLTLFQRELSPYSFDMLPDAVSLFDRRIPVLRDDVRERFEREFYQFLEHRGLMVVLVKRYFKYYGVISEEIRSAGLHPDLIFLAMAESYLNPRSLSRANAAGMWQFIQETGKREGLTVSDSNDERYNVRKATRAAMAHLRRLHNEFGDWLLALAAYNAGAQRLREAVSNQNTKNFFELYLPEETERYIFRIMALKEVIANRERFGIVVYERELYKPFAVHDVTLVLSKETHSNLLARAMDVPYKVYRDHNIHLKRYRLPPGTYHLSVPSEKREVFLKRIQDYDFIRVLK